MEIIKWDKRKNIIFIKKEDKILRAKIISYDEKNETFSLYVFGINQTISLSATPTKLVQKKFSHESSQTQIVSPISGRITQIHVAANQLVNKNQPLITIESMKMENEIRAPFTLFVKSIPITPNHLVKKDEVLLNIEKYQKEDFRNEPNGKKEI